eukprot:Selendium_serpulae@DN2627_c0_g1_i1.p1
MTADNDSSNVVVVEEHFAVPPNVIYSVFLDGSALLRMAQGAETTMNWPNGDGRFSLFAGAINGQILEAEQDAFIHMSWRTKEWPDDAISRVRIYFEREDEGCKVVLRHSDVPKTDEFGNDCIERCEEGWRHNIFDRMEKMLGYPRNRDV